jgi:hypothetical protein
LSKSETTVEAEVILLVNGYLAPVAVAININKGIPVTTQKNRELLDMVTYIRATWQL